MVLDLPSLRKRNWPSGKTTWDIRYYQGSSRKTVSIGEANRRTAEGIYHRFCIRISEGIEPRLSDLAKWMLKKTKSEKTLEREQHSMKKLIEILGDIQISNLTFEKIDEFISIRLIDTQPTTINVDIRVLNHALKQAVDNNTTPGPFKLLKAPHRPAPEWLRENEIANLLKTDDKEFRQFLQLLLYTGIRRNEALGLIWSDIDLRKRLINIRPEISKMGTSRQIPINIELQAVLGDWATRPLGKLFPNYTPNQISMKFRRWSRQVGLSDSISLHGLRATFACHLAKRNVDIYTISKLLGHSSIKMTEKYYLALDQEKAMDAVALLRFNTIKQERRKVAGKRCYEQ